MNDTLHIWNDVWECDERKDRRKETALVMYTSLVLAVLIGLFYASSYIQGGGEKRAYVRCEFFLIKEYSHKFCSWSLVFVTVQIFNGLIVP